MVKTKAENLFASAKHVKYNQIFCGGRRRGARWGPQQMLWAITSEANSAYILRLQFVTPPRTGNLQKIFYHRILFVLMLKQQVLARQVYCTPFTAMLLLFENMRAYSKNMAWERLHFLLPLIFKNTIRWRLILFRTKERLF